jgi:acyl transferase domain-containing protein/acyl carrier protein
MSTSPTFNPAPTNGAPYSPAAGDAAMPDAIASIAETDVAIVGLACRFPGSSTAEAFWEAVRNGRESVRQLDHEEMAADGVPASVLANPAYVARGAPLEEIDKIDAAFFGLSPREAERMDPQHRLMLELAWRALEDAGIAPESPLLTGIFAGCSNPNYLVFNVAVRNPSWFGSPDYVESIIATDRDYLSTRVSYKLGLCGPSVSVQTACSTSLVAVHLACQSLLLGECDVALAGGVALQVPHRSGYLWQPGGYSSRDGRCRPFSADADGTVFGSGGGLVVLRRLQDAIGARDRVIAVVKGSAIGNDGLRKASFAAPSVAGQERVIRAAQAAAGVTGASIGYVEAHGTGTPLGDPIEVAALNAAFAGSGGGHVALGSVKGNIGHLDTAAGIAGLIKTALSLKAGELPPSLHCERVNPAIDFAAGPFFVNVRRRPWPKRAPFAGVSSFGIGGTNAHVVLGPAPAQAHEQEQAQPEQDSGATLLTMSARDAKALRALAQRYATRLTEASEPVTAIAAAAALRRSAHKHRLAVVGTDAAALAQGLEDWVAEAPARSARVHAGEAEAGAGSDLVWVFGGQGGAWPGMGREFMNYAPFGAAVRRIEAVTRNDFAWPVSALLTGEAPTEALQHPWSSQMALFAMQVGLASLWRSLGLWPAAVVGQSVGEIAAAVAAEILPIEDAARLAAARAAAVEAHAIPGQMAWVEINGDTMSELLSELAPAAVQGGTVWVAVYSGPESSVLSGSGEALDDVLRTLSARGIAWRRIATGGLASHGAAAAPAAAVLERKLAGLRTSPPSVAMASTVAGYVDTDASERGARYWADNLRRPVRFDQAIAGLLAQGKRRFLEISPRPTSGAAIEEAARAASVAIGVLASCERDAARATLLDSLARLQVAGFNPDWSVIHPASPPHVELPAYPWQKTRHWIAPQSRAAATSAIEASAAAGGCEASVARLLGRCVVSSLDDRTLFWEGSFDPGADAIWREHMLAGLVIMPAAAILDMVLSAAASALPDLIDGLSEVRFFDAVIAPADGSVALQLAIFRDADGYAFRLSRASAGSRDILRGWQSCAQGRLLTETGEQFSPLDAADSFELERIIEAEEWYAALANRGVAYGPRFRLIERIAVQPDRLAAQVTLPPDMAGAIAAAHAFPALDAALQCLWADELDGVSGPIVPTRIARLRIARDVGPISALVEIHATPAGAAAGRDVRILDGGTPVLEMSGIEAREIHEELQDAYWLSEPLWRSVAPAAAPPPESTRLMWVVVTGEGELGAGFAAFLRERGEACDVIETRAGRDVADAGCWHARLEPVLRKAGGPWRIVHLESVGRREGADENLIASARSDCLGIAGLLRYLSEARLVLPPELITVTRHAADAAPLEVAASVCRAPLWGFLKTVAVEHPELRPRCIDTDADTEAALLFAAIEGCPGEPELALRGGRILMPRLAPVMPTQPGGEPTFDGAASFLVVGATGDLGLPVLGWLVARGARHIVLTARHAPRPDFLLALQRLAADAVEIDFRPLDVADPAAVTTLIAEIADTRPLRGIVHMAGVLRDGFAESLNEGDLAGVLAAKALGAWNLHAATRTMPLDFFVMFSSTAALMGAPGQGAHAAANAVLDLLAGLRRAQGLSACTVDWGPWASGAGGGERTARYRDMGFESLQPARGIRLLETAMRHGNGRYCAFRFDAARWLARFPTLSVPPLLSGRASALPEAASDAANKPSSSSGRTAASGSRRRGRRCEVVVREELAAVLGMEADAIDPERPFAEQNLTSMMALELRSRLEAALDIAIPTTAIWRHPTVTRFAAALSADIARRAALKMPGRPVEFLHDPAAE